MKIIPPTDQKTSNVIDMTERIHGQDALQRFRNLKTRIDLEHAKIALSTSLLSIVILVTVANRNIMSTASNEPEVSQSRAIASVPTGTSDAEDALVASMSHHTLNSQSMGHPSTALESLAYGTLEGKYRIQTNQGLLSTVEFAASRPEEAAAHPTKVGDLENFLAANKSLFPTGFTRSLKVARLESSGLTSETFELVDGVSRPLARVEFNVDSQGRLLSMTVTQHPAVN